MAMTTVAVRTEALTKVFRLGLRGRPMMAVLANVAGDEGARVDENHLSSS